MDRLERHQYRLLASLMRGVDQCRLALVRIAAYEEAIRSAMNILGVNRNAAVAALADAEKGVWR